LKSSSLSIPNLNALRMCSNESIEDRVVQYTKTGLVIS
jgi:hypothetical protein